ncbi:MAG: hypothetical protein ACLQVG_25225 [Terriglobia bacterium]
MGKIVLLAFASFLATGAYGKHEQPPSPPPALPICSILAKAAEFDGKDVTVRMIYYPTPESRLGNGPECPRESVGIQIAPDFKPNKTVQKAWRKIGAYEPVDVVLRGKFTLCRESNCFIHLYWTPYRIDVQEYLSVQPAAAKLK